MEIEQLATLKHSLTSEERLQFDTQMASLRKKPAIALILSLFFGAFGIDRFYVGHTGLGVAKLLTLGGLGFWALVDLFLIMGAARQQNMATAHAIHASLLHMRAGSAH